MRKSDKGGRGRPEDVAKAEDTEKTTRGRPEGGAKDANYIVIVHQVATARA